MTAQPRWGEITPENDLMKKIHLLLVGLLPWLGVPAQAAENWVRYTAEPSGSKVRVDGTSTIHDWTVESKLIGGYIEFDPSFAFEKAQPGKVNARIAVLIPVRQLKSDKTAMDTVMYDAMKEKDYRRIDYRLTEMTLKEAPKSPEAPFLFDTKGELVVSGVTNQVAMPVT